MLVDDAYKDVSLVKEGLLAAGYDVVQVAMSAAALLDRVAAMQPDVIIIDSESPTRDTLEQLSFVSAQQPRPIVLFTEDRANATIQAANQGGGACSRSACSRSSTSPSLASSRTARCATN